MIYLRNGFYDGRTGFAHAARVRQRGVWPIDYTPQKIKEEMTKAFTNKVADVSKQANTLRFYGRASDGMKITIFKDKFGKWSIYPDNSYITINH